MYSIVKKNNSPPIVGHLYKWHATDTCFEFSGMQYYQPAKALTYWCLRKTALKFKGDYLFTIPHNTTN
jgi:hypothetical protein